jgi:hypothetical protein
MSLAQEIKQRPIKAMRGLMIEELFDNQLLEPSETRRRPDRDAPGGDAGGGRDAARHAAARLTKAPDLAPEALIVVC